VHGQPATPESHQGEQFVYHVLCTDTARPLQAASVAGALEAATRESPGALSALCGAWTTEFGAVDQVVSLWRATVPFEPASHDDRLFSPPLDCPERLDHRVSELLTCVFPGLERAEGHAFYDFRRYTLRPGTRGQFLEFMAAALPVRRQHSHNVGVWVPVTGNPDQIIHVWAYRDLAHRNQARAGAWAEPAWQEYLRKIEPLLLRMRTDMLAPLGFSPLR